MNYCPSHWKVVLDSFGHTDILNLEDRLRALKSDFGVDPYMETSILSTQMLVGLARGNLSELQTAIEEQGGCIVCFAGDDLLTKCVETIKHKSINSPRPSN
jgi:hypothetical protein